MPSPLTNPTPRDPDRIPGVLSELMLAWSQYPDQRFWQFLDNVVAMSKKGDFDLWHVEDDVTKQWFHDLYHRAITNPRSQS